MPIGGKPLIEIWLDSLKDIGVEKILINLHYMAGEVQAYLNQSLFGDRMRAVYEERLLGTAGTLIANREFFEGQTTLLAHADNLCLCDFRDFVDFHQHRRPRNTSITMMTFETPDPRSCGIVELDERGIVQRFHEKVENPPGNLANAAIYLIEPSALSWVFSQPQITDFSTQVLPYFLGAIATWKNEGIMRDIGNPGSLIEAQHEVDFPAPAEPDEWHRQYARHPIHAMLKKK